MSILVHRRVRDDRYYQLWLSQISWKSTNLFNYDQNTQAGARIRHLFHVRDTPIDVDDLEKYHKYDDEGFRICQS